LDTREKEKDKKGRKNSVFGNLFKKKQKKPSKDEDISREQEPTEKKSNISSAATAATKAEANDSEDLLRNDWENASATRYGPTTQISGGNQSRGIEDQERTKYTSPDANLSPKQVTHSILKAPRLLFRNYGHKLRRILLRWILISICLQRLRVKAAISKRHRFHGQMPRYIPSWTMIPAFAMYWF
jgi:hypothetical protein